MTVLERLRVAYPPLPDTVAPAATVARLQALYASSGGTAPTDDTKDVRKPRRWRSRRVGLLAVGAVIVTGTALAATTGWRPELGSSNRGPRPVAANADVPTAQLAALAVLRRVQTNADRVPDVRSALRLLSRDEINGVHVDDVRVLRRHADGITLLVPAERIGWHHPGEASAIHRQVLCVMTTLHLMPSGKGPYGVPHRLAPGQVGAGRVCGSLHQLRTTGIGLSVITASRNGFITDTLVPDGVARVAVRIRGGYTITVPVINNVYEFTSDHGPPPYLGVQWIDGHGRRTSH